MYSMLIILGHFKVKFVEKHQSCWQSVDFMLSILGRAHMGALWYTQVHWGTHGCTLHWVHCTLWYTWAHWGALWYTRAASVAKHIASHNTNSTEGPLHGLGAFMCIHTKYEKKYTDMSREPDISTTTNLNF